MPSRKHGVRRAISHAAPVSPGGWQYFTGDEAAAVLTYIRNSWGNAGTAVAAAEVADRRDSRAKNRE